MRGFKEELNKMIELEYKLSNMIDLFCVLELVMVIIVK